MKKESEMKTTNDKDKIYRMSVDGQDLPGMTRGWSPATPLPLPDSMIPLYDVPRVDPEAWVQEKKEKKDREAR